MPIEFDRATLRVLLASQSHSSADLAFLTETLENLVSSAIWAVLLEPDLEEPALYAVRRLLSSDLERGKAGRRFFPDFRSILENPRVFPFNQALETDSPDDRFDYSDQEFRIDNAVDKGVLSGVNSWLRRTIYSQDRDLYCKAINIARIDRLEHHSPLVLETSVLIAAGVAAPALIAYGLFRAVAGWRRQLAEASIREAEAKEKEEVVKQRRIQTEILQELRDAVREQNRRGELKIPDSVLANAAQIASPSVADLGSSSLINEIQVGLTTGAK